MRKIFLLLLSLIHLSMIANDRFCIQNNKFLLDGKEIQLICGEMHYPRIPKEYWRDRLKRAKAMGLNTVSAYVFWNFHERTPGKFDFKGQADLSQFVKMAEEEGLWILLRPGPYVCAEWDFGGYPSWLLTQDMKFRCNDSAFLKACDRYITRLGKELADQTVNNGGNILMVQVENEYGSYGNDKIYLSKLRDMICKAGFNIPLITCDGGGQMKSGCVEGALPTVNGVLGDDIFKIVDRYHPGGPYFVAEFYPAWFDVWGKRHSAVNYPKPAEQLDWMLKNNVSISMYMFHGGTNFWYTNGANTADGYAPQPTSYDYDAPLSEWGFCYPKYHAFRKVIQENLPKGVSLPDIPAANPTITIPEIKLEQTALLSDIFKKRTSSKNPLCMEDLGQDFGYIHYQTTIPSAGKSKLIIKDLRDYAVILVDGLYVGSLDRRHNQNHIELNIEKPGAQLEIVVENVGRVNYGPDIPHNRKGITETVIWNNRQLTDWISTPLPLYKENPAKLKYRKNIQTTTPAFHKGTFTLNETGDSFLDLSRWVKGAVWINGHSLGKFWNIGPQQTLYIPGPWLKKGKNEIVIFAYEDNGTRCIRGLNQPILDSIGIDKNKNGNIIVRDYDRKPILDNGDKIKSIDLKLQNDWQEYPFENSVTLRHLCIESVSSYDDDQEACILEIELLDENRNLIPKDRWQISFVDSEQTQNNIGVAENIIDGDISSFWHTQNDHKKHPHRLIIDLQQIYKVTAFRIKLREGAFLSGKVKKINLYGRPQFFLF